MKRGVLEFRPANEAIVQPINNPINNLFNALVSFVDSVIDDRVNELVEKRLKEIAIPKEVKPVQEEKELVKAKDVAKILKFAESTINSMADRGEIPCSKHTRGKKTFRRFDLEAVKSALKVKQISPNSGT